MDRIQRTGLISLLLLAVVGAVGLLIGNRDADPEALEAAEVVLDPGLLPAVDLVPPEQRRLFVGNGETVFTRPPVRHPLRGGPGRDVNLPVETSSAARVLPLDGGGTPVSASLPPLRSVRVREGDTLEGIAKRELGSRSEWRRVAALNGIQDPGALRIGQLLKLPGSTAAPPEVTESPMVASTPVSSVGSSYVVQEGDTPGEISQKVYGTSRHWKSLLAANGITDPRKIRVGLELVVPRLP